MESIAERGLAELTMAALGRRVGMSGGHLLYYFGTKDRLLLETLRWSERRLGERRRAALGRPGTVRERLTRFAALYLPDDGRDPRWALWVEVWRRAQAVAELRDGQLELELAWQHDAVALLREGTASGELRPRPPFDAERHAVRLRALLDGFGTQLVAGLPGIDRAAALEHVEEHLDAVLAG
ncbi:TetR/AcrR family transcriptional regulator [Allostreptomyces psammosilenae]|nr:TetR/AcrR family transcriptional regulator [Allostreptomyces psammosilenae]